MDQVAGRADDEKIDIGLRDSNGVGFAHMSSPSHNIQQLTMTDLPASEDRKPVIADGPGHDGVGFNKPESEPPNTSIINREQQSAPLVSVIVRSIGRKELKEALDSIALQDYPNIEVVVVDALGKGSPVVGQWCGRCPLRSCSTGQPLSRSRAANLGLESAAGEWLIFLDEDDLFSSEHISKLVDSVINNEGVLAAYSGVRVVDNNNSTIKIFDEPFDLARLRGANFIPIHAVLFNRALVRADTRFDESLEIFEDWDFWLQLTERTRFLRVPGVSAVYRYHLGQSGLSKNSQHEKHLASRALLFSKWNHRYSPQEWVETLYWFEGEREQQLLRVSELEKGISLLQAREAALESRVAEFQSREAVLESRIVELDAEARRYRESLEAILSSTFWKLTTPIRWFRHPIRALLGKNRFAINLAHLKVTLIRAYSYYRKIGLKATARRIIVELRALHTKAHGPSPYSSELLNVHDIHPVVGDISSRIAVHAHVHYPDLTKELASYLKNIPFAFDLFVSVSTDEAREICHQVFSKLPQASRVIVDVVENRGRDIAPMVCHFGARLATYDYICHLHTKKSVYTQGRMADWREYLFRQLLGSEVQVRRIFSMFQGDPNAGIIYPQNYEYLPYWGNTWLSNRALGYQMCRRMGIADVPEGYFDYPAGSMFWARSKALQNLFSAGIKLTDFPSEVGQTDGSLAHCVERLLVLVAKHAGYKPLILADPFSPSWSKWRVDRYMARTLDYVKAVLEAKEIKVIAFDIFDTLLVRPVIHPETTKTIVGHRNQEMVSADFTRLRAHAEELARSRLGRDVGLEDIYSEFASLTGKQVNEVGRLCALEEEVELHLVSPRPECVDMFNYAIRSGKRVVLVSDMFLPRRAVEKMLSENGITGYHALYLSSDIGVRKDTGELYRLLLEREQIAPSELFMVGDNEHSDVQVPMNLGIQVCHVLRPIEVARALPRFSGIIEWTRTKGGLSEQLVLGLVVNKLFRPISYQGLNPASLIHGEPEHIGYAVVGPVVLSFCLWLMDTAKKDGVKKLYFLAREGQLLKAVYDRVVMYVEDAIPSEYLVLSRRAVTVPMIESTDDIFRIAGEHDYFPNELNKFLQYRYGLILEDDDLNDLYKKGLWKEAKLVEVKGDIRQLKPVLEELAEKIAARSRLERPGLTEYLDMIGLNDVASAAVVDVGYSATIQGMLSGFLRKPIQGYYMLTSERARENCNKHNIFARGYYGDQIRSGESGVSPLWRRSFELETFLSSSDPQVICYVLDKYGKPEAVYQEYSDDERKSSDTRASIHSGIISFVDDFFSLRNSVYPELTLPGGLPEMLYGELVEHMSSSEREMLSSLVLDDHYCGRGVVRS
jgi:FMN phosphatase YigB (HAD superfamily)/glycosyltransferase involved in cell wall biosynthesis